MKPSHSYLPRRVAARTHSRTRRFLLPVLIIGAFEAAMAPKQCLAQNAFIQSNLVASVSGMAAHTDTNLVNPWGIAFSATSPFWVSDNHSGLSTLYNGSGAVQALVVTIPPPAGSNNTAAPTGIIANSVPGFLATGTNTAHFIFSTEDGTISAWNSGALAALKVDYSASNAVFKGLTAGGNAGSNFIYATDFHNAQVDVFDTNYHLVTIPGAFTDVSLPAGYAPFGIQNIGGRIFVTYALQDSQKHDDVGGPGNGYVDIFDNNGNLLQQLAQRGSLDSPWGLAVAPPGFGPFANDILVGNFGDGKINAFDPTTGEWLGALNGVNGVPFSEPGLWAIAFGNGHSGGNTQSLYFTAGIQGESAGLLGSLAAQYPSATVGTAFTQSNLVSDIPGMAAFTDTNLVNPWGIAFSGASPFWVSDNHSGLSTLYNSTGAVQALVVTIPPPAGQTSAASPSGIIANAVPGFLATGTNTAHFIFSTEDGTISAWNSGTGAVLKVDYSTSNAVFKGLAAGGSGGTNYIYATDFHNGQVDVFDTNYHLVHVPGAFTDTNVPAGFAPFGIGNIGGKIYVTYAMQDALKHDDIGGPGNGYVDVFDINGNLLQRLIAQWPLNSPWGVALAPFGYGAYSGDLLVGNFGDGRINAFNPTTGGWVGMLMNANGSPLEIPGLWAIAFGNGHSGGDAHTLYFTAGIDGENHGLFGSIAAIAPTFTSVSNIASSATMTLNWVGGTGPFQVQMKTNVTDPAWTALFTTTNHTATVTNTTPRGFFRVLNQGGN
jgi:uncharacterized protein (TIGR03118 family)